MAYHANHHCCVITNDLDFGTVLAMTGATRPIVVQIRAEVLRTQVIGATVIAALRNTWPELEAGALVTVDSTRIRVRVLPF